MIVVKVGGSLFDHPRLGPGLRAYLDSLAPADVLLVPGGGDVVEAVRKLNAIHGLGEEACHWLALTGLWVMAAFLRDLVPGAEYSYYAKPHPKFPTQILDSHMFCQLDEQLPHSWDVTSDSIAARAAVRGDAVRLVLLKSVDVPVGISWEEAAKQGWVDAHFPKVVANAAFPIEIVNFRRVLDATQM